MNILAIFGTRPEAIKMCPLVKVLKEKDNIICKVCLTGQHKEMLRQVMDVFEIKEDYNLDIMQNSQTLTDISAGVLRKLEMILVSEKPDLVLVHGDTTTAFCSALAAYYQKIPVGHVEAGLRTYNRYFPFPEEMNRSLISRITTIHFAPTNLNKQNLLQENIHENIFVTGNTVIDAFKITVKETYIFKNGILNTIDYHNCKVILLTAHRRENIGNPLENICNAINALVERRPNVIVVYPVHLNPAVRKIVNMLLGDHERIILTEPLDIMDMHNLIKRSYLVLTDSGGLQEEAPAFGKPVLVLRKETERLEAVEAGTVRLVGTRTDEILNATMELLDSDDAYMQMAKAINPYGDGHASQRIYEALCKWENGNNDEI